MAESPSLPIKFLQVLLVVVDALITLITFGWLRAADKATAGTPTRSVAVGSDPAHRRRSGFKDELLERPAGTNATTLYEMASYSFEMHRNEVAMRSRKYLGMKSKRVKEFEPGSIDLTYEKVGEMAHKFGAALRSVGMEAAPTTTTLDKNTNPCRMAIFENTCAEWMISALGAISQSITVTTVYATLGHDAVAQAVSDNSIPVIVCNKTEVEALLKQIKAMPTLKVLVFTNNMVAPTDEIPIPTPPEGITVVSFDDFIASGDTSKFPSVPPSPETTAVVMYTSGSTGNPKGVVMTHANVVAAASGPDFLLGLGPNDRVVAYLPLAHILELCVEFIGLAGGGCICYADPRSLASSGAFPQGALELFQPTHMVGVPKIWDTMRKGVLGSVAKMSPVQKAIVDVGMQWKTWCTKHHLDTPLFNALVFDKMKAAMGGKLRWALSGGGPLGGDTQLFVRAAFGTILVQAYGLTESCATVSMQADEDMRPGIQGPPFPSTEVKLVSTPEITDKDGVPYLSTDRKDADGNPIWGRGEVWIKGASVSKGYYMMPEKTKEDYHDGWFATGDIAQWTSDGSLSIVDRKKNLVKLKAGEYVRLEAMEIVYGNAEYVDAMNGGICCYADGDMDRPAALMQLSIHKALEWAKANGVDEDPEALKKNKELEKVVMDSLLAEFKNSDLSRIEKLAGVSMLTDPWTTENGCLTAANKIQRRTVYTKYPKEFEEAKKKGIFD